MPQSRRPSRSDGNTLSSDEDRGTEIQPSRLASDDGNLREGFSERPVWFWPAAGGDQVCFGSDDGWLYCLTLAEG